MDIAGLVKGAASGEGLGNAFLSHIKQVCCEGSVLRGQESRRERSDGRAHQLSTVRSFKPRHPRPRWTASFT